MKLSDIRILVNDKKISGEIYTKFHNVNIEVKGCLLSAIYDEYLHIYDLEYNRDYSIRLQVEDNVFELGNFKLTKKSIVRHSHDIDTYKLTFQPIEE
jgi:hypothetical protein